MIRFSISLFLLILSWILSPGCNHDDTTIHFNLPQGPAEQRLLEFVDQAHLEILFSAESVKNIQTNSVNGNYSPEKALRLMLKGSGLEISSNPPKNSYAIFKPQTESARLQPTDLKSN